MSDTPSFSEKELPQRALRIIRKLCHGNGVEADSVQIKDARGELIQCEAITHLELHPDISSETKKGRQQVGQVVQSAAEIEGIVNKFTQKAIKNEDTRKLLTSLLLDRPDKGFAIHAEYFDVPQLSRDYCYHEACGDCEGQGKSTCHQCGGRRQGPCTQCHGRRMVPCPHCQSAGYNTGPVGEKIQCVHCHGQRQIGCRLCGRSGVVACRQCKGSGSSTCRTCTGAAFFTHITHFALRLKTLFEIDRVALPHPAVKIIEDQGGKMVAGGHIKLTADQVKREDGGLAIQYQTHFPYGDLNFTINGKPYKTHLFGYKGKMLKLPPFLDHLIENNFNHLHDAAQGQGNVVSKIQKASKTRLIGQGIYLAATLPQKKAMMGLKKKFPLGVSNQILKDIIILSHKAINNITRKTRYTGLAIGLGMAALMDGVYFIGQMRGQIPQFAPPYGLVGIDLIILILGGLMTMKIINFMAGRPLARAIGHLLPDNKKKKFKSRQGGNVFLPYMGSALIFIGVLLLAKYMNLPVPFWFN